MPSPPAAACGGDLVLRDQLLDLGDEFGRALAGYLADHVVDLLAGPGRLADAARTLANARGGLAEDLAENLAKPADARARRLTGRWRGLAKFAQDLAHQIAEPATAGLGANLGL